MPLMNSSFAPGECLKTVETMEEGSRQDIAWAEYYYFSGQPEKAIEKAECYLDSERYWGSSFCLFNLFLCVFTFQSGSPGISGSCAN